MELEASVFAGDDELQALPILRVGDGDAGARQRATGLRVDDRPGDSVRAGRNQGSRRGLGLRQRGPEQKRAGRPEYCLSASYKDRNHWSFSETPAEMLVEINCNCTCSFCPPTTRTTGPFES